MNAISNYEIRMNLIRSIGIEGLPDVYSIDGDPAPSQYWFQRFIDREIERWLFTRSQLPKINSVTKKFQWPFVEEAAFQPPPLKRSIAMENLHAATDADLDLV